VTRGSAPRRSTIDIATYFGLESVAPLALRFDFDFSAWPCRRSINNPGVSPKIAATTRPPGFVPRSNISLSDDGSGATVTAALAVACAGAGCGKADCGAAVCVAAGGVVLTAVSGRTTSPA